MSEAAEAFGKVVTMEHDALLADKQDDGTDCGESMMFGPWSFKALKQVVKVRLRTGELDLVRDSYHRLLNGISSPNERLWCKTNLKYGQLLYEMNETPKLQLVIRDLLKTMHQGDDENSNDPTSSSSTNNNTTTSSSTNLMEIYALQIQLHSRQKDNKKLRQIFAKAMRVQGGIPHPRTLALIQELGGKMHMASREFEAG